MNIVFDSSAAFLLFGGFCIGALTGWLIGFEKGKFEGFIAGRRTKA